MKTIWVTVAAIGGATTAIKAIGPLALGRRTIPPRLYRVVDLLAPAVLSALIVTQLFGGTRQLVIDARVAGFAVAAVAVWRRAPLLLVVVLAAATTALVRVIF